MDTLRQITELGSFGLVVAFVLSIAYVGKRILAGLEHFAKTIEETLRETSSTLAQMQIDNAAHFSRDDVVQTRIVEELNRLAGLNRDDHSIIKALIEANHNSNVRVTRE